MVVQALTNWKLEPLADDVQLCTSELVTNAARYARREVGLDLYYWPELAVVAVEVTDDNPDLPSLGQADAADEHGRGLRIVEVYSDGWEARPLPDGGKAVFAVFGLPRHGVHTPGPSKGERQEGGPV
jgi:anti-sigma regulatory factor (Ser/Thr protein kinase)